MIREIAMNVASAMLGFVAGCALVLKVSRDIIRRSKCRFCGLPIYKASK